MFGYFSKKVVVFMYYFSGHPSNVGKYLHFSYPYLQVSSEIRPRIHMYWLIKAQSPNRVQSAMMSTGVISLRGQSPGTEILVPRQVVRDLPGHRRGRYPVQQDWRGQVRVSNPMLWQAPCPTQCKPKTTPSLQSQTFSSFLPKPRLLALFPLGEHSYCRTRPHPFT